MTSTPIGPLNGIRPDFQFDAQAVTESKNNFEQYVKDSLEQVNNALVSSDKAIERLQTGEAQSLHEVMIAVEKADLSLRMFVQVKNKAMQAYEEIMRMQV